MTKRKYFLDKYKNVMAKNKLTIETTPDGYKISIPKSEEELNDLISVIESAIIDSFYAVFSKEEDEDKEGQNLLGMMTITAFYEAMNYIKSDNPEKYEEIMESFRYKYRDESIIKLELKANPHKSGPKEKDKDT